MSAVVTDSLVAQFGIQDNSQKDLALIQKNVASGATKIQQSLGNIGGRPGANVFDETNPRGLTKGLRSASHAMSQMSMMMGVHGRKLFEIGMVADGVAHAYERIKHSAGSFGGGTMLAGGMAAGSISLALWAFEHAEEQNKARRESIEKTESYSKEAAKARFVEVPTTERGKRLQGEAEVRQREADDAQKALDEKKKQLGTLSAGNFLSGVQQTGGALLSVVPKMLGATGTANFLTAAMDAEIADMKKLKTDAESSQKAATGLRGLAQSERESFAQVWMRSTTTNQEIAAKNAVGAHFGARALPLTDEFSLAQKKKDLEREAALRGRNPEEIKMLLAGVDKENTAEKFALRRDIQNELRSRMSISFTKGPESMYSKIAGAANDPIEIQEESNKTLQAILNVLEKSNKSLDAIPNEMGLQ